MMNAENFKIENLIFNDFFGKSTPEEKQFLDSWLAESADNQRYFSEQKKLWNLFSVHQKMQKIDEQKAFRKVSEKLFFQKKISVFGYFQRIAAILFFPLLLASAYYYYNQNSNREQYSSVYNTVETPLGMRSSLTLPDGTKVWLNAGSKLSYPVLFAGDYRAVKLSGEAYFEVKKNPKWPFVVTSGNMNIIVTGTTFNCNAYPENDQIQTVLVEGQVTIINASSTLSKVLVPGELAVFRKNTQQLSKVKTDLEKYIAWKSGKLMFRDDKMNKVVEMMERWYNVDFEIEDKEIEDYVYNATFNEESLDQVLKLLSLSAPIRYTVSERTKLDDQTYARQVVKLYKKKI